MRWTKVILEKNGFPVKVYVNEDDSRCVVFPLFGKYYGVNSDTSAIDLCIEIMFHVSSEYGNPGIQTLGQYTRSSEDTAIIELEAA